MKKAVVFLLILTLVVCLASCDEPSVSEPDPTPDYNDPDHPVYGLTLGDNGTLLLDGDPIYAYGVNLFDVFVNKRMYDPSFDVEKPFSLLSADGISVVRTCIGPFYENGFARYFYEPEEYFEALDTVIAAAEKYHIGIIASLMWNNTLLPDWVGEHMSKAYGDKNSETVKLAKKYFTDVVSRYKDSPAIWAWEFGNEYNLGADLKSMANVVGTSMPGVVRTEEDYYTSYDVSNFYSEVGKAIREADPYRLIVGGDSELSSRPAALRNKNSWDADTYEDVVESTKLYAIDPLGAVSSHFYHSNHKGAQLPDYSTDSEDKIYDQWLSWGIDAAKSVKKGYYVGEYGPGEALNNGKGTDALWCECIDHLHESFLRNDVQIALGWLCVNDFTATKRLNGLDKHWYDEIVRINNDFRSQGKQTNIESYWSKAVPFFDSSETFGTASNYFLCAGNPGTVLDFNNVLLSSNYWQASNYDTNGSVTVADGKLPDGTQGKVFRIENLDSSAKTLLKFTSLKGMKANEGTYKLSFWLKTEGNPESGLSLRLGTPNFFTAEGVKCDRQGEWQHFEFVTEIPSIQKSSYSFTVNFESQQGAFEICGLELADNY